MLLIHDLGEIDAGDTIIYASEFELKASATVSVDFMSILPDGMGNELLAQFGMSIVSRERRQYSRFAKAIDIEKPLLR